MSFQAIIMCVWDCKLEECHILGGRSDQFEFFVCLFSRVIRTTYKIMVKSHAVRVTTKEKSSIEMTR